MQPRSHDAARSRGVADKDIEFEQDEFNRLKLQQQLEQAIESREERLRRQERDDQKDFLRKQIEGINERMDGELKALDKEQDELEKAYAERMKSAALRAEAEMTIMLVGLVTAPEPRRGYAIRCLRATRWLVGLRPPSSRKVRIRFSVF